MAKVLLLETKIFAGFLGRSSSFYEGGAGSAGKSPSHQGNSFAKFIQRRFIFLSDMDYYGNFTGDLVGCRPGLKIPLTGVPTLPPTPPPPPPTGKPGEAGPPGQQVSTTALT